MELYQIRYFLAVAESLSFTRASERVFVSQPALTKAIQRLEETLGGRLFDRANSNVQLTPFGRALLPRLQELQALADGARHQARRLCAEPRDVVRVGVMSSIEMGGLLQRLSSDEGGLADVELSFQEGDQAELTQALDEGALDLAVLACLEDLPRRYRTESLLEEDYVLTFGDDHRFHGRDRIELAELNRENYCLRTHCEAFNAVWALLDERGVRLQVVHRADREDWAQAFVRANLGVSLMPRSLARAAGLDCASVSDLPVRRQITLATHTARPIGAGLAQVMSGLAPCRLGLAEPGGGAAHSAPC